MSRAPLLAIDTSTETGVVAVGTAAGDILGELAVRVRARHSEALLPAIEFALARAGIETRELAGIVVGGGPGSFTGVRIAAATAKGMAHALGIEMYAYSSLLALAASAAQADRAVCAVVDARRGDVYAACYRFPDLERVETIIEPDVLPIDDLATAIAGREPLFVGDGALAHRGRLAPLGLIAPPRFAAPRASALLWLVERRPEGRVPNATTWEPAYLRPSGAERGGPQ